MTANELRDKYLEFFKSKGHSIIPSDSLVPENDPTTLFTGSGMQPIIPYLLGEKHPEGIRICNSQKCFRQSDIEEVGDNRHNTFFEMLGNWSFGDYFKKEQLTWMFEFLTKELKIDAKNLYVTVYRGNKNINIGKDKESVKIWDKLFNEAGIDSKDIDFPERDGMQGGRIFYYDDEKNWWSRSGVPANMPLGEPGGPDSEMFYDLGENLKRHEKSQWKNEPCHVNCDCGRFIEIGNNVFMEYVKTEKGFEPLKQKNVDFGGGLERMTMVAQGKNNIYETDLFYNILQKISWLSGKNYKEHTKEFEIIADHIKAATFIMGDDKGITPSNTDQGYVVRRLIRRAIRYGKQIGITESPWTKEVAKIVVHDYFKTYPELRENVDFIINNFKEEEEKFSKTLERGEKQITGDMIDGQMAFNLFQTYGYPFEMTEEIAVEKNIKISKNFKKEFDEEMKRHQELSRTASAGKFKGGLADAGEDTKKLHTAAHLLLAALRKVLGDHVVQKGSNITAERLRFDFSHGEKMTDEQKQKVEELVNKAIEKNLPVKCEEMSLDEAKKQNAMGVFESKYGEKVKVYTIGNSSATSAGSGQTSSEPPFSREICGGPHVEKTGVLGSFKIKKEGSSSAGVRRIKAILE